MQAGYTTPWAASGIPAKAVKWLFRGYLPLLFKPDGSRFQWQLDHECAVKLFHRALSNQLKNAWYVRISEYSREMFRLFEAETGLDFEGRHQGTLQIFRTQKEMAAVAKDIGVLAECGAPYQRFQPEECLQFEPALHHALDKIAGVLHLPSDGMPDCHLFTLYLQAIVKEN
nr:FAD-dependent oxidoreductase [Neisseria iguanae]